MSRMKKNYDLAFSMGDACFCTQALRAAGLQFLSFPLDWAGCPEAHALLRNTEELCGEFAGWYQRENLVYDGEDPKRDEDFYFDTVHRIVLRHDFPTGTSVDDAIPKAKAKLARRAKRQLDLIRASKRVLVLRIEHDERTTTPDPELVEARERLRRKFPGVEFDLTVLFNRENVTAKDATSRAVADGVTVFYLDVRYSADWLRGNVEVPDYRTPAEIRAWKDYERRKKMLSLHARTPFEYRMLRYRRQLYRLVHRKSPPETYDLVFGIGNACSCTQSIRAAGLQYLSFPFDWIIYKNGEHDLRARADIIRDRFTAWLEAEDLELAGSVDWHPCDVYYNRKTDTIFNHEFPRGKPIAETFPAVSGKYRRRIERFYELVAKSRRVLIVRLDRPDQSPPTDVKDSKYAMRVLREVFPGVDFDMAHVAFEKGRPVDRALVEDYGKGLVRIAFDYADTTPQAPAWGVDTALVGRFLKARYAVRDYRTAAEKAAKRRHDRLERYRSRGASNWLEFKLVRCREKFERLRMKYSPSLLLAKLRRRKFEHVVPLGVNCETAFRFYRTWKFLDSSLFAWTQSFGLAKLTAALGNLDALFAGEVTLDPVSKMWICGNTGIYAHGQLRWQEGVPTPTEDQIAADRRNVVGRMAHLKEKFRRYAADGESTLFIHRLSEGDERDAGLAGRLDGLERALEGLGAKNWTLLVVCEREFLPRMPPASGHRLYRAVGKFNPGHAITDTKYGDNLGWKLVYTEFAPAKKLPKKHDFKFE